MNDSGTRSDYHLSFRDHHCHHGLTRRSLRLCLLCAVPQRTHTHTLTQNVNVTTCIIDLRSQLQQTPTVIKKRLFCFISPLRFPYQLICIINSGWRCPRKQLPLWFLLLGILSYFRVSMLLVVQHQVYCIQDYTYTFKCFNTAKNRCLFKVLFKDFLFV